jgi:hypothetical protein
MAWCKVDPGAVLSDTHASAALPGRDGARPLRTSALSLHPYPDPPGVLVHMAAVKLPGGIDMLRVTGQ